MFVVTCRYVVKKGWIESYVVTKILLESVKKQATTRIISLGKYMIICTITMGS